MSHESGTFYLPAAKLAGLARDASSGLRPVLDWAEGSPIFVLRDCFEQSLRRSRRLLIEAGDQAVLLMPDGRVLRQRAAPDARFVAGFAQGPVRVALSDLSPLRALLTVASGKVQGGRLALIDDEGKTRVRAELRLLEPVRGAAVVLVTPQGLRGYDAARAELVARLRALGGVPLSAGNLYRMIDPSSTDYIAKPVVPLGREETAFDAATDLIASYIPVARANEPGVIEDLDTEFLHDYRIALRKIRSVLSLFKDVYDPAQTEALKARFAVLMAQTGRVRDLDVQILEHEAFAAMVPATLQGGLEHMFALIRQTREAEHARLANHLQTGRYDKEIRALAKLFAKRHRLIQGPNATRTAHDLAAMLIRKRYRGICRGAERIDPETPDAEIHSLRIACKKLRYLLEFFAPVFARAQMEAVLKPMKRLQDSLGLFNDCAVQQATLQAFVAELGAVPHRMEIAQAAGALIAALDRRQQEERGHLAEAFARFTNDRMRRRFAALSQDGKEP